MHDLEIGAVTLIMTFWGNFIDDTQKVSEYDQEIPQSQTADKPVPS